MIMNRRGILTGLGALIVAPAIVQYGNLMPVKVLKPSRLFGTPVEAMSVEVGDLIIVGAPSGAIIFDNQGNTHVKCHSDESREVWYALAKSEGKILATTITEKPGPEWPECYAKAYHGPFKCPEVNEQGNWTDVRATSELNQISELVFGYGGVKII